MKVLREKFDAKNLRFEKLAFYEGKKVTIQSINSQGFESCVLRHSKHGITEIFKMEGPKVDINSNGLIYIEGFVYQSYYANSRNHISESLYPKIYIKERWYVDFDSIHFDKTLKEEKKTTCDVWPNCGCDTQKQKLDCLPRFTFK